MSDEERAEILAWIAKQRAEYYASNDTAPEHRNEPVQPIPQKLPTDAQKVALGLRCITIPVYRLIAPFHALIAMR